MKHSVIPSKPNAIPTPQEARRCQPGFFSKERTYYLVDSKLAVQAAHFILSPARRSPCVLVTCPFRRSSFISATSLAEELDMDDATVLETTDSRTVAIINGYLPENMHTRGGACRIFPVVDAWDGMHSRFLYLAYSEEEGRRQSGKIIFETRNLAYGKTYTTITSAPQNMCVDTEVFVKGIYGDKVTLQTVDGKTCLQLDTDGLPTDFPLERLFKREMRLTGVWMKDTGLFSPHDLPWLDAHAALEKYRAGMTFPGKISGVYDDRVVVELFPSVRGSKPYDIRIARDELLGEDGPADLRAIFRIGDVVPVKIEARQGDEWLCSLGTACDTVAPSLISGGSSWLEMDGSSFARLRALLDKPDFKGDPGTLKRNLLLMVSDVAKGKQVISDLCDRLALSTEALQKALSSEASLKKMADIQKRKLRALNEKLLCDSFLGVSGAFEDDEEQLDLEIRLVYALMFPAEDKKNHPLHDWDGTPDFYKTLNNLPSDVSRKDVVEAIVRVLTDLDWRKTHQRRNGMGGSNPSQRVEDGLILQQTEIALKYRLYFTRSQKNVRFYSIADHSNDRVR